MNVLNNLTNKHIKLNKRRTIVTILAIALSTILMLGVGISFSTFKKLQIDLIGSFYGDYHAEFSHLKNNDVKEIIKVEEIEKYNFRKAVGINGIDGNYNVTFKANRNFLEKIKLSKGKLPEKEDEIIVSDNKYKIGDTYLVNHCKLKINNRDVLIEDARYSEKLKITDCKEEKTTVVGIIKQDLGSNYIGISNANNYQLEEDFNNIEGDISLFVYFKKNNNVQEKIDIVNRTKIYNYQLNLPLLTVLGDVKFGNINRVYSNIIKAINIILLIGCSIVIYNSFAISVVERKKQFGTLSSIGTTRFQIIKMVFYEIFIVGSVGVILGGLISYLLSYSAIYIINYLFKDLLPITIAVYTDYSFLLISITFIIATIIISGIFPAIMASRTSPIELIRQNNDIKIDKRKIKSPKIIEKLFGIEGSISFKNMKRNKKKYRISMVSIIISIILFIAGYTYSTGIRSSIYSATNEFQENSRVYINSNDHISMEERNDFIKKIMNNKNISEAMIINEQYIGVSNLEDKTLYESDYYIKNGIISLYVYEIDIDNYKKILKSMGKSDIKPILYNKEIINNYEKTKRTTIEQKKFIKKPDKIVLDNGIEINDFYLGDFKYKNDNIFNSQTSIGVLIVPEGYFKDKIKFSTTTIYLDVNDPNAFKLDLENYASGLNIDYDFVNLDELISNFNKLLLVLNGLTYSFILLVTLVGITSLINTIATSMNLRKKEFAILRSIGLTPNGFNKMLVLESIFIGIKAIIFSLPFVITIIAIYNNTINDLYIGEYYIPWMGLIFAVVMVISIIIIITIYSTKKIKKENILDSLKNENI